MLRSPTLYKITRKPASGDSIVVETTNKAPNAQTHVLFCGGFHSSMRGIKADFLSTLCQSYGWGFTRFDYLGHGASDGVVEHCTMQDWLDDTLAVLDTLSDQVILVGSSMGAWLAVHASLQRQHQIKALVTIAAAPDFTQKLLWPALSNQQREAIENDECISVPTHYDGVDWRIRQCLFDSGKALSILNQNQALAITVPVRMLHGTGDTDVPWQLSHQLLEKFSNSSDASLTLLRGADHRLSDAHSLSELELVLNRLANE